MIRLPEHAKGVAALRPRWRRLLARALLVLGCVLVGFQLKRAAPTENTLDFRLPEASAAGRFVVTWTRDGENEPLGGVDLHFPQGVPKRIQHRVSLSNGSYLIAVQLEMLPDQAVTSSPATLAQGSAVVASSTELGAHAQGGVGGGARSAASAEARSVAVDAATSFTRRVNLEGGSTIITLQGS